MVPTGLPSALQRRAASAMACITAGCVNWPTWPMLADRSAGPMNTASTPSTPAIASSCASACGVSSCTITPMPASADFR